MSQTLTDAAAQNDIAAATNILKQRRDVNKKAAAGVYEGFTPLMIAAALGNLQMVKLLLDNGADVFIMDSRMGTTALHKAAQNGNCEVAELLLKNGSFIDSQAPTLGNTPLLDAVWHKHLEMVKLLLENGARTELTNGAGNKPIDIATTDNSRKIIDLLNTRDARRAQKIASQKLMSAVEGNDLRRVEEIITKGADVDEKAPLVGRRFDGYTPLLAAAFLGHHGIVQKLLDEGADPKKVDDQIKATAGHKAGYHGHTKAADILVKDRRLDLDAQGPYNGYTALHDAIWHCHKETIKVFLDAGARLDLRTHTGHTPLELAKFYCRCCPEIETLIQNKMAAKKYQSAGDFIQENPIISVAVAVALGAALALMLPSTRRERKLIGEASDEVKASVRESVAETVDRAKDVVRTATEVAADAALKEATHGHETAGGAGGLKL